MQASGCRRISASPGYCEKMLMEAPWSTWLTSISRTMPRWFLAPLYSKAVSFLVVVDMRPGSTAGKERSG